MRWAVLGAVALVLAGVALVALGVLEGGAHVALVVIVPVVWGSSPTFLLGVLLLLIGIVAVPFSLTVGEEEEVPIPRAERPGSASVEGGAGGLVLIGPVPILFGSWKGISRRQRWALALVGAVVLIVAVAAFVWFVR